MFKLDQVIKKISFPLLAILLCFSFTSCQNSTDTTDTNDNKEVIETEKADDAKSDEKEVTETDKEANKEDQDKEDTNEEAKTIGDCCAQISKEIFVSADYLKDVFDGKKDIKDYVIAEVTWGEDDASPDYLKNHIPGAIHINTDSVEEGPVWNLKSDDEIVKSILNYGIDKDTTVFLYGPDSGVARVALAYLIEGVENIKIINGGIKAWMDKGYETESKANKAVAKTDFKGEYPAHPELLVSLDQAIKDIEDKDENKQYITTRTYEEYIGETSGYTYIPKAGELPGAIYGHDEADYKNADGTYISYDDMVEMLKKEGVKLSKEMIFYCGTGWRAAIPVLKFYERGFKVKLFDGGWNEWQMHDELPVQLGDPKTDVKMTTVGELSNDKAKKE